MMDIIYIDIYHIFCGLSLSKKIINVMMMTIRMMGRLLLVYYICMSQFY